MAQICSDGQQGDGPINHVYRKIITSGLSNENVYPVVEDLTVSVGTALFREHVLEQEAEEPVAEEPGLQEFLQDSSLSGTATATEVEFLKRLKFQGRRPTPLYYYRELQNLRDPLHFRTP